MTHRTHVPSHRGEGAPTAEIIPIYLRIAPGDIAYVKFLFEAYEEIAIVRTIDRRSAVIVVLVMRGFLQPARAVLDEICRQLACVEITRPAEEGDDWLMREV
jgi:hypothetical protein